MSSRISDLEKSQKKEYLRRQTTDCNNASLENANLKIRNGGLFNIYHDVCTTQVFCDLETDGGGWIVFQRRVDGSVDFYRGWEDYVDGFGDKANEFWLGLEALHRITICGRYELRIDLEDWEGHIQYAAYRFFEIGSAASKYRITLGDYFGNAGDAMGDINGMKFSTKDQDNDIYVKGCAVLYKGAWWYSASHGGNLNGRYLKGTHMSYGDGVNWNTWLGPHTVSIHI